MDIIKVLENDKSAYFKNFAGIIPSDEFLPLAIKKRATMQGYSA